VLALSVEAAVFTMNDPQQTFNFDVSHIVKLMATAPVNVNLLTPVEVDPYSDGNQCPLNGVEGERIRIHCSVGFSTRDLTLHAGQFYKHVFDGNIDSVVSHISAAEKQGTLMSLLERRISVLRLNALMICILGSRETDETDSFSHEVIAELLIAKKLNLKARDSLGNTCLHYSTSAPVRLSSKRISELFLGGHVDIDAANRFGETALSQAVMTENIWSVGFLLRAGANLDYKDLNGFSVWTLASECSNSLIHSMLQNFKLTSKPAVSVGKSKISRAFVVLDTNILLWCLALVKRMMDKVRWCKVIPVIPYTVVQEIDGLKKSHDAGISKKASEAVNWIHLLAYDEKSEAGFEDRNDVSKKEICNDDRILAVAERLLEKHEKNSDVLVFLLTNDKNLQTKARIHHVPVLMNEQQSQHTKSSWISCFQNVKTK
jgi:rRNA-processing protein FCF1